ncbi:MAG: dockerin type I repeat-containing protein [Oscillospiraceae bacterium]|nr:dockerin type I repeat-containing protein [Oscillospiraceae bacterium]
MRIRLFGMLVAAVFAAAAVPSFGAAAEPEIISGSGENGIFYEGRNEAGIGDFEITENPGGGLTASWDAVQSCCTKYGQSLSTPIQPGRIGGIKVFYDMTPESTGNACLCVRASAVHPMRSYCVIEGWFGDRPEIDGELLRADEMIDGAEYDVYRRDCTAELGGEEVWYPEYISVRKENLFRSGGKRNVLRTVPLSEHIAIFDYMDSADLDRLPLQSVWLEMDVQAAEGQTASGSWSLTEPEIKYLREVHDSEPSLWWDIKKETRDPPQWSFRAFEYIQLPEQGTHRFEMNGFVRAPHGYSFSYEWDGVSRYAGEYGSTYYGTPRDCEGLKMHYDAAIDLNGDSFYGVHTGVRINYRKEELIIVEGWTGELHLPGELYGPSSFEVNGVEYEWYCTYLTDMPDWCVRKENKLTHEGLSRIADTVDVEEIVQEVYHKPADLNYCLLYVQARENAEQKATGSFRVYEGISDSWVLFDPWIPLSQLISRPGDANCDGTVDVSDAVLVLRYACEDRSIVITEQGMKNSDTDGDGNVGDHDATLILQYIAKKITLKTDAE